MRRRALLLVLLAVIGAGCSTTIQAQVLDAATRQPIEGASVLGVWTRVAGPLLYHHELVGVRETETDAEGRFALERLRSSGLNGEGGGQAITVYKFGYVAWSNLYLFPALQLRKDQRVPGEILLERFPSGESHQRHMIFVDSARAAGMYGHEMMPKFSNAILQEMRLP